MSGVPTDAYRKVLEDSTLSDFCITSNGHSFKVHRIILTAASEFFRATCQEGFKEHKESCIEFPDDPPEIVARIIHYLYTGEYSSGTTAEISALLSRSSSAGPATHHPEGTETSRDDDDLIKRMKVDIMTHQCADKLFLKALASAAVKSFRESLAAYRESDRKSSLAGVVELALESTASNDIELRQYLIEQCGTEYEVVEKDELLLSVIKKHEFMAWTTAQRSEARYKTLQEKADGVSEKLQEKKRELNLKTYDARTLQESLNSIKTEAAKLRSALNGVVKDLSGKATTTAVSAQIKHCPHCGEKGFISITDEYVPAQNRASNARGRGGSRGGAMSPPPHEHLPKYQFQFCTQCVACGKKGPFLKEN